jgi:hypothetical protein
MACIGCSAVGRLPVNGSSGSAWTGGATRPVPSPTDDPGDVMLAIAPDISLGIDVAGIVDALQGAPLLDAQPHRQAASDPWVRWIQHF